jgi:transposase-like protein
MGHYPEMRLVQIYSEDFKRQVIEEYLAGKIGMRAILRKYKIGGKETLYRWMKKIYNTDLANPSRPKFAAITCAIVSKKNDSANRDDLAKRIKELERRLEDEKLRSEAYARIIEKAEKELKIPIRKKPNTK